jgi:hypothetical protein
MVTSPESANDINIKVKHLFGYLRKNVDQSDRLHSLGANTKLSASLEDLVTNPFKAMIDMNNMAITSLKKTVNNLVVHYFQSKKNLIVKAFYVEQKSKLTYYVVLKEDSTENRDVFFEFLSFYDEVGLEDSLPLVIKFLPYNVMDKSGLKDELILN